MIKAIYKSFVPERMRIRLRQTLHKMIYPLYLGHRFHCNCCDKHFRKFLTKGNVPRPNAQCPYCHSLERTRVLSFYLEKELQLLHRPGIRMLHFAPEPSLLSIFDRLDIEYLDVDINPALARTVVDITAIPYPDDYFDLIICSHVLGHVPDEKKAHQEMYRVLKPTGIAIMMTVMDLSSETTLEDPTTIRPSDRLAKYGESDLVRLHGQDFGDRIAEAGFKVTRIDYRTVFSEEKQEKHRLGNGARELIFRAQKC